MINQEDITARKIVELLEEGSQYVDMTTLARLSAARQQAVAAIEESPRIAMLRPAIAGWHHVQQLSHHGGYRIWLPVIFLLAALAAAVGSNWNKKNQYDFDTDSQLLAAELPPEAYADKEFVAWLESTSRQ